MAYDIHPNVHHYKDKIVKAHSVLNEEAKTSMVDAKKKVEKALKAIAKITTAAEEKHIAAQRNLQVSERKDLAKIPIPQ